MSRIQKVKQHVRNNKAVYITGATCLTVGALGGGLWAARQAEVIQKAQINGIVNWKPTLNSIQITIPRAGNAGKVFIDKATGEYFMSTGKLAAALGVSRTDVARYLKGEIPDLAGRQFEMILDGVGEIVVNQTLAPAV